MNNLKIRRLEDDLVEVLDNSDVEIEVKRLILTDLLHLVESQMQKAHDASRNNYWRNLPEITTPIVAEELNRNEQSVDTIDDRVVMFDITKANQSDMLQAVKSVTFNDQTGVFRITFFNESYVDIDTDIEKIAINFDYDDDPTSPHYQQIIIELEDGTYKYIDLSALITQYEFIDSAQIHFDVVGGEITASIINGSITENKLRPNFLAEVILEREKAEQASSDSEAWAVGQRGGSDVPITDPTYENNSKYYAEFADDRATDAETASQAAEDTLEEVIRVANNITFEVNWQTGNLEYTDNSAYSFSINETTGNLEWEVVV